jgi:two-component system NtrC family sensor kinase
MPHQRGFRSFALRAMRAARRARPTEELAEDLCRALSEVVPCRTVELWLPEEEGLARWCLDIERDHFAGLPALEPAVAGALARASQPDTGGGGNPRERLAAVVRAALETELGPMVCSPLGPQPHVAGMLVLTSRDGVQLGRMDPALLRDLSQALTAALTHNQLQQAQRERVKELSCLYALARLATEPGLDLDGSLQRVVELLPPSWQHPEQTAARLMLDGVTWATRAIDPDWAAQRAPIIVGDNERGFIEVAYTEPMPALFEGPFLEEERKLLDTVAREVSTLIERKAALEDRVALQDQLQHADRLATMGHLAAGVAHELNEPLGAILGFAQLARKHPDIPTGVDRDLAQIEAAALHAREVTARLMHVGRRNAPRRERLDLSAVVGDGLSFVGARLAKHRIELQCSLEPDLPAIHANRSQLQQIVINLVVNAIQAMPDGGTLSVETRAEHQALVLEVQDTGVGMPEAVQARIFDPFFTTKQADDGTGLGLAVVRSILESMGGAIQVDSAPEKGATFLVRIPLETDPPDRPGRNP